MSRRVLSHPLFPAAVVFVAVFIFATVIWPPISLRHLQKMPVEFQEPTTLLLQHARGVRLMLDLELECRISNPFRYAWFRSEFAKDITNKTERAFKAAADDTLDLVGTDQYKDAFKAAFYRRLNASLRRYGIEVRSIWIIGSRPVPL